MPLRYVVLDFDGTCTEIDKAHEGFLTKYREVLEDANVRPRGALQAKWDGAKQRVTEASPHAGWTLFDVPSTAPSAADPYILASEVAALLQREQAIGKPPDYTYACAYEANPAPWRPEVREVLAALVGCGVKVGFISNSSAKKIEARLADWRADPELRDVHVLGSAEKYRVRELLVGAAGASEPHRARFERLDGSVRAEGLRRPIYLRRGAYFDALCELWAKFEDHDFPIADTLVCGDVWELDLAMPHALGAHVHLIERAAPFDTYPYERELAGAGNISRDLHGLVAHVERLRKG